MKRLAGQAGRTIGGFFHLLGMFLITLFLVVAVLLGGLAYRLSQGPLQIPWITTLLANAVSGEDVDINVGQAALAWSGFKKGGAAPLYLQLGRVTVHNAVNNAGGVQLAEIPDARVELTPSQLLSKTAAIYVSSTDVRFAGANVPVSLLGGFQFGSGFRLSHANLAVTLGAGALGPPGFAWPLAGAKFELDLSPKHATLTNGLITLTPIGASAPVIHVAGAAYRDSDIWHAAITVTGSAVQAQDLPHYWPVQLVPQTRKWVTTNITAGTADAPDFTATFSAVHRLANVTLDNVTGSFHAENLTLTWLPGARPITALNGSLTVTDPNNIEIIADHAMLGGISINAAGLHIAGVSEPNQTGTLHIPITGSIPDAFAILGPPPLNLLNSVPQAVLGSTGDLAATIDVMLPFKNNLTIGEVDLKVATRMTNVMLPLPVEGMVLHGGAFDLQATTRGLDVAGQARLAGAPAEITGAALFGPGAGSVKVEMKTAVTDKTLASLGLNPGAALRGEMPLDVQVNMPPAGSGRLAIAADLTPAAVKLPMFGWSKPAGEPGKIDFAATIEGQNFSGISKVVTIDAHASGLDVQSQAQAGGINFSRIHIGNTDGAGRIALPATANAPWQFDFFGNTLDASEELNPPKPAANAPVTPARPAPPKPQVPSGIIWRASAHFDHVLLAKAPASPLNDFNFAGNGQGSSVFDADATGTLISGQPVNLAIESNGAQPGAQEALQLNTADGGELMRTIGAYQELSGGALDFNATYGTETVLSGTTTLTNFRLLKAPAVAKLLQALTVVGIPAAASGPGLEFHKLIAPFSMEGGVMTLTGARAYSASLGFTASGTINLNAGIYDIHGTVVPAYALNTLPGRIPIIGRLFSPEKGGGLFAMRYSMTGTTAEPKIKVNPLSALTPGFFREIFGFGDASETK
jgi:hypothetical protein